jgi:hypothetical protein
MVLAAYAVAADADANAVQNAIAVKRSSLH